MIARPTTVILAVATLFAVLACSGGTDTTGPGLGPATDAPDPAPAPVTPSPANPGRGGKGRRGGGGAPSGTELVGKGYGEARTIDCPNCNSPSCNTYSAHASTELNDARRSERMLDDMVSTAWCSNGTGKGDTIAFDIPAGCRLYGFTIGGGYLNSTADLKENSRIAEFGVDVDGKSYSAYLDDPVDVALASAQDSPAYFDIPGHPDTRKMTFTLRDLYDGRSGNTCVSDVVLFMSSIGGDDGGGGGGGGVPGGGRGKGSKGGR